VQDHPAGIDRRTLIKTSAATAALFATSRLVHARGSDTIRVGVIGCGGRGTGAAFNCVAAAPGVEVHAVGDLFAERVLKAREQLLKLGPACQVTDATSFVGWDAFRQVLASPVDLVILATPPHFRPAHLTAAIEAGKHVFMEKPVAVDAPGVRQVIAAAQQAKSKQLAIVAGTQRRHQTEYLESMQRIHDGAIGEIVGGQCWWNQGSLWMYPRQPEWSDMEWQLRNWLYFTWLSGDHICEQHIHNIDVMNWAIGATPLKANGLGGRQVRTDPAYGHVYDHFAVELEYPGGVLVQSSARQIDGCANRVGERLVGTKGTSDPASWIDGAQPWDWAGEPSDPYQQEHTDLIASIRAGTPLNEGRRVAESTLTAIMGRMATYTGQTVTWEQALASAEDLSPPVYEFGALPVAAVAVPGKTRLL
jgi:myo-inositol 2-dehydrogenase / D-chiro-inositol 1-dehydrogenase